MQRMCRRSKRPLSRDREEVAIRQMPANRNRFLTVSLRARLYFQRGRGREIVTVWRREIESAAGKFLRRQR